MGVTGFILSYDFSNASCLAVSPFPSYYFLELFFFTSHRCVFDFQKGQKDSPPKVYFLSDELKIGKTGKKNERISTPF